MARPALSASRALAVLNFLAAQGDEAFTLSELARRIDVNVASLHAVLNVLTDGGYVVRHPRLRTFALGPSVVALGSAAMERHPSIDTARDAARQLSERFGLEVAVSAPAGDEIVFLARAGEHLGRGVQLHVGQRVPMRPPFGSVFATWNDPAGWAARSPDPGRAAETLDTVRRRGFAVAIEHDARRQLGAALDRLAAEPADDALRQRVGTLVDELGEREYHLRNIEPGLRYDVSLIAAPVFDSTARVALALTLVGFSGPQTGAAITALGEAVADTGRAVTRKSGGRYP